MIVKVCGVTTLEDAEACVALGVDWIGLNFVPGSPRCIDPARAKAIGDAVRGRCKMIGVVADFGGPAELAVLAHDARLDALQLHGDEPPDLVARLTMGTTPPNPRSVLLPTAYKALRIGSAEDVADAERYPGLILVDAKVAGALGGTGHTVDFGLVAPLAGRRPVLLAGGLRPDNVAEAVRAVRPWGIDVASGVERSPGVKDRGAVAAFVESARQAWAAVGGPACSPS